MSTHLLDLPTEVLNQILTPLPTLSLLRFSETSHHARSLANANLHTLSLGIAPFTRLYSNLLEELDQPSKSTCTTSNSIKNPYAIWLYMPTYEYWTLLNFQSVLVTSILNRHSTMLQHLEISVWALTLPMVGAIAKLRALRRFSLRIERAIGRRRSCIAVEREEQRKAWELLTECKPVWSGRLMALRLDNCDLEVGQLAVLLGGSRGCEQLGLDWCRYLDKSLWTWLMGWKERGSLRVLDVADSGGMTLGEEAKMAMAKLHGLQSLNLHNCREQEPGEFERCNRSVWHVPNFVAPRSGGYGADMIIEVDPEYI